MSEARSQPLSKLNGEKKAAEKPRERIPDTLSMGINERRAKGGGPQRSRIPPLMSNEVNLNCQVNPAARGRKERCVTVTDHWHGFVVHIF